MDKVNKRTGLLSKRLFDIALALILCIASLPIFAVLVIIVTVRDGRPFLYKSKRCKTFDLTFDLVKIRTMRLVPDHENIGVTGGHKSNRITSLGRWLRRYRLDELPQLWNVLKGDMSFVGPRPPEPRYVMARPNVYRQVLKDQPGITGLASIIFHLHEEKMLAACLAQEDAEKVYLRRSVPRKATLDRLYHDNRSLKLDLYILYLTAAKLMPLPGRRAQRIRRQLVT